MTCRHIELGGVRAILCDRARPPRMHYAPMAHTVPRAEARTACNRDWAGLLLTDNAYEVTCRRCLAAMRAKLKANAQQLVHEALQPAGER